MGRTADDVRALSIGVIVVSALIGRLHPSRCARGPMSPATIRLFALAPHLLQPPRQCSIPSIQYNYTGAVIYRFGRLQILSRRGAKSTGPRKCSELGVSGIRIWLYRGGSSTTVIRIRARRRPQFALSNPSSAPPARLSPLKPLGGTVESGRPFSCTQAQAIGTASGKHTGSLRYADKSAESLGSGVISVSGKICDGER